jgi:hypothetical protein
MPERPPFDTVRACFYLVAAVIAVQCLVVLVGVVWCALITVDRPSRCEELRGLLGEVLTGALAAALAFAGGYNRPKPPPGE